MVLVCHGSITAARLFRAIIRSTIARAVATTAGATTAAGAVPPPAATTAVEKIDLPAVEF